MHIRGRCYGKFTLVISYFRIKVSHFIIRKYSSFLSAALFSVSGTALVRLQAGPCKNGKFQWKLHPDEMDQHHFTVAEMT